MHKTQEPENDDRSPQPALGASQEVVDLTYAAWHTLPADAVPLHSRGCGNADCPRQLVSLRALFLIDPEEVSVL